MSNKKLFWVDLIMKASLWVTQVGFRFEPKLKVTNTKEELMVECFEIGTCIRNRRVGMVLLESIGVVD